MPGRSLPIQIQSALAARAPRFARAVAVALLAAVALVAAPASAESVGSAPQQALPDPPAATPTQLTVDLYKPLRCKPSDKRLGRRKLWLCESEQVKRVSLAGGKVVGEQQLPDGPARNPYPVEFTDLWRTCPFRHLASLDALPAVFNAYQDLDIPRCYVFDPFDRSRLGSVKRGQGPAKADTLIPYFAGVIERMMVYAAEQGWDLRIASAHRSSSSKVVTVRERVKRHGKWVQVARRKSVSTKGLHAWGLACDVLFLHYNSLKVATSDYRHDPSWRKKWLQLVEFGEKRGLFWLGHDTDAEISHFEFHPGWASYPSGQLRQQILSVERSQGYRAVWTLLKPAAGRALELAHLADAVGDAK